MKKKTLISRLLRHSTLIIITSVLITFSACNGDTPQHDTPAVAAQPPQPEPEKGLCSQCNVYCISDDCLLDENCADPACLDEIQLAHELTRSQYLSLIKAYYGAAAPPLPKIMLRHEIETLVNHPCNSHRILFDLMETDPGTHNTMLLYPEPGHARPMGEINSYSISFFNALLRDASITEFRFSRGKSCPDHTHNTMMVAAAYGPNEIPVYYGDLTDVYPVAARAKVVYP